jgi:galactokinase/mevalonate kinase-like predicted kinase
MYKRVTHTITEEHFGHAMAAEIKKVVDKTIVPPKPKMEPAAASKVKADISDYLTGFNKGLIEIYKAIDSPDNIGLGDAETTVFAKIDDLG